MPVVPADTPMQLPVARPAKGPAEAGLGPWLDRPQLRAMTRGNFCVVTSGFISQHVPGILDAADQIRAHLQAARQHRSR